MSRVLLVEDHAPLARMVAEGLGGAGYDTDVATDGIIALSRLQQRDYDAIVLDWMLPRMDGMTLLRRLRSEGYDMPVILLTAKDAIEDRVLGLDAGADDYVVKPFAFDELLARVRAVVRRKKGGSARVVELADLRIDTAARTVHRGGREIPLSSREYAVLECLALNRGRIVDRDRLIAHAYDGKAEPESNVIDVYVAHLRRKVDGEAVPKLIHTRRGMGYILAVLD